MNIEEALKLRENNVHLIGKLYKGQKIHDVAICPSDPEEFSGFMRYYLNDNTGVAYPATDYNVLIFIDIEKYIQTGFLIFERIENLVDEFDVKLN